jgi:quercetin dioxygenase-like cupin family protein
MTTPRATCVGAGEHQVFQPQEGMKLHLLHSGSSYQVFLIEAGADTRYRAAPHEGQELRYVISGRVTFTVGEQEHAVDAGGTLSHPSRVDHGFHTGSQPAIFVTFALGRGYDVTRLFRGTSHPVVVVDHD